jgi:hypothetical protein
MLIGTTAPAASAQATRAPTGRATSSASRLPVSAALQRQLLGLYAGYRHIPTSDIGQAAPRSVQGARTGTATDWAVMLFVPAATALLPVRVEFQDGADIGLFTRKPGKAWQVVGLGGRPLGCDSRLPGPVRRLWGFSSCLAASPRTATSHAPSVAGPSVAAPSVAAPSVAGPSVAGLSAAAESGTASGIATIAENEIGVSDNPAETSFGGLDCNPFTAFENSSASAAGCGTDPSFNVLNRSELWCSDFAKWAWIQGGVTSNLGTLTPLSSSFYTWGLGQGDSMPVDGTNASVGDAMVLYPPGTSGTSGLEDGGAHVGIVTAVNSNGTIDVVNGDFLTASNIEVVAYDNISPAAFAAETEGNSGEEWVFVSPQLPAGSSTPLASSPVTTYGTQLQVFGRAANEQAYSDVWTPGKSWSGWNSIGGGLTGDPTALEYDTSNYGQQLEVFGRYGGTTYANVWTPASAKWSGWISLGGSIVSDPVAIQYGTQMQVFGLAANGQTYSDVWTPGGTWSGWNSIGGGLTGQLSVVQYDTSNYGQQLEVFGQDGGTTYANVWTPASAKWSGWTGLGGSITGNPAAIQYGTQVQVFGRAANGQTYSDVYTPGKTWSGWNSIGGNLLP